MNLTIDTHEEFFNLPSEEEIKNAVKICCGRFCNACESPVEYAWRKRRVDLADLLDIAIERELTDPEKDVIKSIYFDNLTNAQTAAVLGLSKSTVYQTCKRAMEKLKRCLGYTVMYQQDYLGNGKTDSRLLDALRIVGSKNSESRNFGEGVKKLRLSKALSLEKVAKAANIPKSKILRIEKGETEPTLNEAINLCGLYNTSIYKLIGRNENDGNEQPCSPV